MFTGNHSSVPSTSFSFASFRLACWGLIAGIAAATTPCTLSAGTIASWNGSSNFNWGTTANWNPSVNAPTASTSGTTYSLVFGGTTRTTTVNDVGTVSIDSMSFTNAGGTGQNQFFTISGGTLAFNNASITTSSASGSPFGANTEGDAISSAMTLSGTTTVTLGALHNLSLTGNISDNGSLVFDDLSPGTTQFVYLSGSNSYSGGTQIRGGFVQTSARTPTSSSNNDALGIGAVTISDNGTLLVRNNSVITNTLTVSGSGSGGSSLTGSFGVASGTAVYAGAITVAGDTRFNSSSSAAGDSASKFVISGPIDLGSNQLTLRSQAATGASAGLLIEITGTISGSGGINIVSSTATGRVLLSGSNSYSGGTTITTGTLTVGNGSALGTGFLAVNTSGLNLNGQALTVGALSGSSSGVIQSSVAGAASLTTTAATDSTYDGTIINGNGSAVVGLTKAGIGALTLTGSNGYTGVTNIDGGVLAVDSANAINGGGDITFGGGALRYSAANQVDYSAQFKQSTAAISIDTNGQTVSYDNPIASTNLGGLTKTGSGTLFLNAANQFAGATTVNAGTLSGTGSVLELLSVQPGAVFDPGSSPTATTIFGVGSFAQAAGGTTRMQVSGTTAGLAYDQVLFSGPSKTVSWGGLLDLTLSGSYADYTAFNLFSGFTSFSGNLSGISFAAPGSPYATLSFGGPVNGVWYTGTTGAGQSMTFSQTTGVLTVVPEPTAVALAAVGVAICGLHSFRRRRRPVSE